MKNYLLYFFVISFSCLITLVYGQQPENQGFEFWEEVGFGPDTLEPVGWSSLKTSDGGDFINNAIPVVWERSTDAHSGMYSVKLTNEPILTLVAPGTLTNGRVHAALPPTDAYVYTIDSLPEFSTPFTGLPDSLVAWGKYFPQDNDIAHIIAILHSDTAKIPDPMMTDWIAVATIDFDGQTGSWTRFSSPFIYLNGNTPEYILFAIFAGDAQNALAGSQLYLDDLQLVYYNTGLNEISGQKTHIWLSNSNLVIERNQSFQNELVLLEVSDMFGRIIYHQKINLNKTTNLQFDQPPGIYICRVAGTTFNFSQKIIKR